MTFLTPTQQAFWLTIFKPAQAVNCAIESPELFTSHVVKQADGNPQAIHDMVDESAKEWVVDKRRIREMKHQAGIRYLDFTPGDDRRRRLHHRRVLPRHRARRYGALHPRGHGRGPVSVLALHAVSRGRQGQLIKRCEVEAACGVFKP
jgi:hypothetical protein